MISSRTLNKWRKDALTDNEAKEGVLTIYTNTRAELTNRILLLTQELLDLHLIKK